jgi:hypothetical protein
MILSKSIIWYIAGPMTGIPQFNYPLFRRAARRMRATGHTIVSPAEMDSALMQAQAEASPDGSPTQLAKDTGETWGDVLARDVRVISDEIGGIIVLPNWFKSRGARLEVFVGLLTGKEFAVYDDLTEMPYPVDRVWMQELIKGNMP